MLRRGQGACYAGPLPEKAMILAAGRGTRLAPLTDRVPKCMVPIAGKPILEYTIETMQRFGVTRIAINVFHLPEVIIDYFGTGERWGVEISYSVETEPLGTAGGVKRMSPFLDGGPFFVWYGDNLSTCDLAKLYAFHRSKGGVATIALYDREDVTASGIVGLDVNDRIARFLEKPSPEHVFSHWVNAAIFVLEPSVLSAIPSEGTPDFGRDVFPGLLRDGASLFGYRMAPDEGLWWIDTPDDLRSVERLLSGRNESTS